MSCYNRPMDTDWSALRPDPRNARKHTSRNRQLLSASLAEVGAARSIVIDEDGTILAGNATAEAARKKGLRLQILVSRSQTPARIRPSGRGPPPTGLPLRSLAGTRSCQSQPSGATNCEAGLN